VKMLVGGGAIVAFLTLYESRAQYNVFDHLQQFIPLLRFDEPPDVGNDGRGYRAYASAQHPIALGAALALLVPLSIYLGRRYRSKLWWAAAAALALGVLTTVARTATLMLMIEVVMLIVLKPKVMFRLWPWAIPMLAVVHIAVPGTIGALKDSFFPKGGLIAEQSQNAGTYGSGRVADLGPGLQEWKKTPYFGQGFGTRITDRNNPHYNAPILDNQMLGWLLETGIIGMAALLWLFFRSIRRLSRAARRDPTEHGWLMASLAASILAFLIGMATYDAFAFTQVVILLFMFMGIGCAALRLKTPPEEIAAVQAAAQRPARAAR
jgi:O-antigen ligase